MNSRHRRSSQTSAESSSTAFPAPRNKVNVLPETPLREPADDSLRFEDYAEVLVEHLRIPTVWPVGVGIYAEWGAGKSSLLKLILDKMKAGKVQETCLQWMKRSIWNLPIVYAVWTACKVITLSCYRACSRMRIVYKPVPGTHQGDDIEEQGEIALGGGPNTGRNRCATPCWGRTPLVEPASGSEAVVVTNVVASFDAWLFADSDLLWAVLISKIFEEVCQTLTAAATGPVRSNFIESTSRMTTHPVFSRSCPPMTANSGIFNGIMQVEGHPSFGKGVVRARRVRTAVQEATFMEWVCGVLCALVTAGLCAVVILLAEKIGEIDELVAKIFSPVAIAAVPIAVARWAFKVNSSLLGGPYVLR